MSCCKNFLAHVNKQYTQMYFQPLLDIRLPGEMPCRCSEYVQVTLPAHKLDQWAIAVVYFLQIAIILNS